MHELRQRAFKTLTSAEPAVLKKFILKTRPPYKYSIIRPAQTGLIMLRGRVGNTGNAFNVGEVLVTRCSVMLNDKIGCGYILGENVEMAEHIAVIDAMIQNDNKSGKIKKLLDRIEKNIQKKRIKTMKEVAATKVDFYTMVRGED